MKKYFSLILLLSIAQTSITQAATLTWRVANANSAEFNECTAVLIQVNTGGPYGYSGLSYFEITRERNGWVALQCDPPESTQINAIATMGMSGGFNRAGIISITIPAWGSQFTPLNGDYWYQSHLGIPIAQDCSIPQTGMSAFYYLLIFNSDIYSATEYALIGWSENENGGKLVDTMDPTLGTLSVIFHLPENKYELYWRSIDNPPYHVLNTPVPIPYSWFEEYKLVEPESTYDVYEAAAKDTTLKGYEIWRDYVTGAIPTNAASRFITYTGITNDVVYIWWEPDLEHDRIYTILGKTNLSDPNEKWQPTNNVPNATFFKVKVEMP